jgi:hypothetical protein
MHDFLRINVHHADRVAPEFRNKQPMACQIDRHVIDTPAHLAQRYFGLELQYRPFRPAKAS